MEADGWIGKKQEDGSTSWTFKEEIKTAAAARAKYGKDTEFYEGGDRVFTQKGTSNQMNLTKGGEIKPVNIKPSLPSLGSETAAAQIGGGLAVNSIRDLAKSRMDFSRYSLGSTSYSSPFADAEIDFHGMNSAKSLNQMKTLSSTMGFMSKSIDFMGYLDGAGQIYNGNIASGTYSLGNNYAGIQIGSRLGWGYGLLYSASYTGAEYILTRSETYNSIMFGKGSSKYNQRKHHWTKSQLLNE